MIKQDEPASSAQSHGSPKKRYDVTYKMLVIGESGVGKTALLDRYTFPKRPFDPNPLPTLGIDYRTCHEIVDSLRIRVQIWDTVGQERFRTMTKLYFRGAKGILLVFDLTDRNSFLRTSDWVDDLKEHGLERESLLLIGNKLDLDKEREVDTEEGIQLARGLGVAYYETSAKSGHGVTEVFTQLILNMKDANNPFDVGGTDLSPDDDLNEDWEQLFNVYVSGKEENPSKLSEQQITRHRSCCS